MQNNSHQKKIERLSNKELIMNVYASQVLFIVIAILLSLLLFDSFDVFLDLFQFNWLEILIFGGIPAIIIVFIDIILIRLLPKKAYDDGGINEKLFKSLSIPHIFIITLVIAFAEELLFRGVIHTFAGYIIASLLFALIHFRYLKKTVLLISVLLLSFVIGYMYELTNNLLVPITAHFLIDFLLGIYYRHFMR
ncbi:CPBP family intramembrane glutamic endopeptidase [Halalkalibacillus halophilus]|uniref:CPBP family intramembrane glutamic endopeptidase n=1 Tax=Halalkalibacillus halophilus TaxID=392827 RepID=UPI0003F820A0|nr:CPBP family intramembrane glutamic endopeptidase [Halalkalibacillus halophilus]